MTSGGNLNPANADLGGWVDEFTRRCLTPNSLVHYRHAPFPSAKGEVALNATVPSEVFGWTHTLNERPDRKTAKFYITYGLAHVLGAVVVLLSLNLANLVIDVEVMNALLLPIVLGFLLALEARALPSDYRMHGARRVIATGLCLGVIGFGLFMAPVTLGWL